jgi:hypothetical protein
MRATYPVHVILFDSLTLIISGKLANYRYLETAEAPSVSMLVVPDPEDGSILRRLLFAIIAF